MSFPNLSTRPQWKAALDSLPSAGKIPAFFYAHGSPTLIWPPEIPNPRFGQFGKIMPKGGLLNQFLQDFGHTLIEKYNPKALVIFSAHWETLGERLVTDYGDENPLYHDFYGFPDQMYDLEWKSKGDHNLAKHVVDLFAKAGLFARLSPITESRGQDGRPNPPLVSAGFDHGVSVPSSIMFPLKAGETFQIPVIQVSIDSSLDPAKEYAIGKAVSALRDEGVAVLAGGLHIHSFRDLKSWNPETADQKYHDFHRAFVEAAAVQDPIERKEALFNLTKHHGFRDSNPREEHMVPIYIAAGAGEQGKSKVLCDLYGASTIAFGL